MNDNLEQLADTLEDLSQIVRNLSKLTYLSKLKSEDIAKQVEALEGVKKPDVNFYLKKLGLKPHFAGYSYILAIIDQLEKINKKETVISITKTLYPDVAKIYKTTWQKVERSIRHAIETSYFKNEEVYKKILGINEKPTNKQFIYLVLGLLEE